MSEIETEYKITETALEAKPEAGIYYDIPSEQYHGWPGASNSRLKAMLQSPMHCWWAMTNPPDPTPAMITGTAYHTSILEPERFDAEYIPVEQCGAIKKSGDRCTNDAKGISGGVWLCGVHGKGLFAEQSKIILPPDDFKACLALRKIVRTEHKLVKNFFESEHQIEVSATWDDEEFETRLKLRADLICEPLQTIVDIKTTTDASKVEFEKHIYDMGYHRQAAFYLDGLQKLGKPLLYFIFVVVEKIPPYGVAVYWLNNDAVEAGRFEYRRLLEEYAVCERNNWWPGYTQDLQEISIPNYGKRQIFKFA